MQRPLLRRWMTFVAPVVAVCLSAIQVSAADVVPADKRLGTDVIGFFSIRNVGELKAALSETQLGQLIQDKELAPFLAQFEGQWEKVTSSFNEEVGLPLEEVLSVFQGEVAGAMLYSVGKPLGGIGLMDFGDKREIVDKLLEKIDKSIADAGNGKRSEEEIDGTQVVIYTFAPSDSEDSDDDEEEDEEESKPAAPVTIAYLLKDTTLVVASRVDVLKNVLNRWNGDGDRQFAEKQAYKYLKQRCSGDKPDYVPHLTFYIDPVGILKGGLAAAEVESTQSAMVLGALPTLGLDKLKAIGGTVDFGTDEYDTISRMLIYLDSPPSGLLNAFQFPVKDLTPPKWVPADVSTYGAINWDLAGAYTTAETLYDSFLGQGAMARSVDELATAEEGPKVHLKNDLIDQLNGTIRVVGSVDAESEDVSAEHYLIGLELNGEDTIRSVLERLADLEGFPISVREFEGQKIYEMESSDDEEEDEEIATYRPAVAVLKGQLLFATHVTELEAAIRGNGDGEALVDTEAYQQIAKRIPEQTSSFSFQRSDAQLKVLYEALRSGALSELSSEDVEIDTSTLPEFEVLRKYFLPSGGYMVPDENGWFTTGFSLKAKTE